MRRPATRRVILAVLAHNCFELGVGAGLPGQSLLGLRPCSALWAATLAGWWRTTARTSVRAGHTSAFLNGLSLSGVLVHVAGWRWRRVGGVPMPAAHWLPTRHLPAYNTVLTIWAVCTADALTHEVEPEFRRSALLALGTVPALIAAARAEARWVARRHIERPAWWNRAGDPRIAHAA